MVVSRADYEPDAVAAARPVLVELIHLLGEYRDDVVIVRGWVPLLALPEAAHLHIGTLDVDLALDYRALQEPAYRTIRQLLLARGYREGPQPFIFYRAVPAGETSILVQVDLLSGEYEGTGKGHHTQSIQDVRARKARGSDLAFDIYREIIIEGEVLFLQPHWTTLCSRFRSFGRPGGSSNQTTRRLPARCIPAREAGAQMNPPLAPDITYNITSVAPPFGANWVL